MQTFTAPVAGNYLFIVAGGGGGGSVDGQFGYSVGGLGAKVEATVFLQLDAVVPIVVAEQGSNGTSLCGGGGGGLSAVYTNGTTAPTIVAGRAIVSLT